jgi:prophage regulatory protein
MNTTLQKFIKLPDVMKATGKSRSSIYAAISKGLFPAPLKIGPRATAWPIESIRRWQESCLTAMNQ